MKYKQFTILHLTLFCTNCKVKINNSYNVWDYYFKPVSKYKLEEVYKSKNVLICDNRTSEKGFSLSNYKSKFKYFNGFQYLDNRHKKIVKKYIKINKNILKESDRFVEKNFRNKKILGVCFRGSDQKKSAYQPYPPTEKQLLYATNHLLKKYRFDKCIEIKRIRIYFFYRRRNFIKQIRGDENHCFWYFSKV